MGELEVRCLEELLLEPPRGTDWVVEDLISMGLHLLVGPPKVGKSWLSLLLALCVSAGEPFLGFATAKAGVLYLALEDTFERVKQRSWKLVDEARGELFFAVASEGVATGLIPQLQAHPGTRLVIVDTFQMVRPASKFENPYAADYRDLSPLKALAASNRSIPTCSPQSRVPTTKTRTRIVITLTTVARSWKTMRAMTMTTTMTPKGAAASTRMSSTESLTSGGRLRRTSGSEALRFCWAPIARCRG